MNGPSAAEGTARRRTEAAEHAIASRLRRYGALATVVGGVLLILILLGWVLGVPWLQKIVPGTAPVNPLLMAALGLVNVSAWLQQQDKPRRKRRAALVYGFAAAAAAVGALKLIDYGFGTHLCADDLLFASRLAENGGAGEHISKFDAVCLVLLGCLSLMIDIGRPERTLLHVQVLLGLPLLGIFMFAFVAFFFHVIVGTTVKNFDFTVSAWMAMSSIVVGLLMSRPDAGQARVFSAPTYSGFVARVMYPLAFWTPAVVGLLYAFALRGGWYPPAAAFAAMVMQFTLIVLGITVLNAIRLHRMDTQRQKTLDELHVGLLRDEQARRMNESLIQTEALARSMASNQLNATHTLLAYLARRTGIPQLCLFCLVDENGDAPQLEVLANYAYGEMHLNERRRVAFGEGLAGQCAAERRTVMVDRVPEAYFKIRATSVELVPRHLLLIPLTVNEEFVGVLEAALLQPLAPEMQAYLDKAVDIVAYAIYRLRQEQRVQALLRGVGRMGAPEPSELFV
jgi:hypothetical protein